MPRTWTTPRRILCATDMTPACDRAVDRALQLAGYWKASLLVVHIVDDTGLQTEDFNVRAHNAETELGRQVKIHPSAAGLEVETVVSLGDPAERILAKCERLLVDVLVMGRRDQRSLRQRLLGSTIDHVLRHALQPVLTVRNPTHGSYRTMAVATDFSWPSMEALEGALVLFPDSKTTVVHSCEEALHGLTESDRVTGPLAEQHKKEIRATANRSMVEFVESVRGHCPDLSTAILTGKPVVGIKQYVEQHDPNLLVVGTHGRTGLHRALIGSVAETLIGTLPCDVLAVRPVE